MSVSLIKKASGQVIAVIKSEHYNITMITAELTISKIFIEPALKPK